MAVGADIKAALRTVLGIDTATLTASVAIARGGADSCEILAMGESDVNSHSQHLLGLIDSALAECGLTLADLDGIAVGAGPGSFTGLRIGMATAKGLAFAADKPLWAVSSLAALAMHAHGTASVNERTLVVPILDARRMEIFAGFYRVLGNRARAVADEVVLPPSALRERLAEVLHASGCRRAVALGDGLAVYPEELSSLRELATTLEQVSATPSAAGVARLALVDEHEDVLLAGAPSYVRLSEAEIKYPNGNPGRAAPGRS